MGFSLQNRSGLISIIVPSYNHRRYVGEAVMSALSQTYEDIEVIVVDDGSLDGSPDLIAAIKDSRLTLVRQQNKGAHAAINRGLEMAKGDFVAILNSDDLYHPTRLEKAITAFESDRDLELISSWIHIVNSDGAVIATKKGWENLHPWPLRRAEAGYKKTDDFNLNLLASNFVSTTSNIVCRKALLARIGMMRNLKFVHDWDFLLRASAASKCAQICEPLIKYRVHEANTITTDRRAMLFEICWVFAANIHRFEGRIIFNSTDSGALSNDIEMLHESTNFQGNDKLVWIMRSFIEAQKSIGRANPDEILLEDPVVRERFISLVADVTANQDGPVGSLINFLVRRFRSYKLGFGN
ncbi:MAG: glycosyltransferase [Nitrospira sp.]|jgi:glycosyltransferase involved in cell wall biosynthesis|nr:glycosyltransferase [Nitrospira sp.]